MEERAFKWFVKKSELYSSLWAGADSLRGGMDASEYKNYVLNLLFLKYMQKQGVVVDVACDLGGCIETIHQTSHSNPVYVEE
ncbi:type I restriction-modification system subunit M N-terminal domain-containing protein, partial [Helicobacter pylori]|uniref:type I restriction-modification system subunit M N-terminal domain-containing protein n=1 Tax=Helicobacter pylori TaxID=210 RepID=UPI0016009F92